MHWVKEQPKVKRALNLVGDVREIEESIKESRNLIARLERPSTPRRKIKIFPEFAVGQDQRAGGGEPPGCRLRKQILSARAQADRAGGSADERAQLHRPAQARAAWSSEVQSCPRAATASSSATTSQLQRLVVLEQELSRSAMMVERPQGPAGGRGEVLRGHPGR